MSSFSSPPDDKTHCFGLGFFASAADPVEAVREYLVGPLGIPAILDKLDNLVERINTTVSESQAKVHIGIRDWWGVLPRFSRFSWGVELLLQCDFAAFLRRLR